MTRVFDGLLTNLSDVLKLAGLESMIPLMSSPPFENPRPDKRPRVDQQDQRQQPREHQGSQQQESRAHFEPPDTAGTTTPQNILAPAISRLNTLPGFPDANPAIVPQADVFFSDAAGQNGMYRAPQLWVDGQQQRRLPRAEPLSFVLPQRTCEAIVKFQHHDDVTASIATCFTSDPTQCSLEIDIKRDEVPHLATVLFSARIEYNEKKRSWVHKLDNGVNMAVSGELMLDGADDGAIQKHLGNTIHTALSSSGDRRKEVLSGNRQLTHLVSLSVDSKADLPGLLKIMLDAEQLTYLKSLLFAG